jgi:hypothetical protein
MYYNSRNSRKPRVHYMQNANMGYVRVLHAVPDAPNVDIYANDEILAEDLAFGEYTDYIEVPVGDYEVSLYVAGTMDTPVLSNMLLVEEDEVTTVAATGTLDTIEFLAIPDSKMRMDSTKAMVRFVHLSPDAPAVDITLPDGTVLLENVSFGYLTPYITVAPDEYTLQARVAGTPNVALTVPGVNVDAGNLYSVYAIGLVEGEPQLEALLLVDKSDV